MAFDYRQSNANLARDPFSQPRNSVFPVGLKNQFGGSIGGPIVKDKIFFFCDYQGVRQKSGVSAVQTVPSQLLVNSCLTTAFCDFSEYATAQGVADKVANPAGYQLLYNSSSGATVPYAGNRIPVAQVSAPSLNLLKLLAPYAPNRNEGGAFSGLRNNYSAGGTGGLNSDQWDARGDWQATGRTHVFGRFSRFTDTLTGKTLFGAAGGAGFGLNGYGGTSKGANDSAAAGVDVALSNSLVTDVRLGYFRYNIATSKYDQGVGLPPGRRIRQHWQQYELPPRRQHLQSPDRNCVSGEPGHGHSRRVWSELRHRRLRVDLWSRRDAEFAGLGGSGSNGGRWRHRHRHSSGLPAGNWTPGPGLPDSTEQWFAAGSGFLSQRAVTADDASPTNT